MRLSRRFGRTLREAPADAVLVSHQLAMRAGLARPHGAGVWSYLPMGWRVMQRIEALLREEMSAIGAEEFRLPGATTHPEAVTGLCLSEIESYKDLPRAVYQFQAHLRDDARAGGGLIHLRAPIFLDAYSLHADAGDLQAFYDEMLGIYDTIFARCGLDMIRAEAERDPVSGVSHAFVLPHPAGDAGLARCDGCDYAALAGVAAFERGATQDTELRPMEKVATPGCKTIADLCAFLNVEPQQTLKAVFYTVDAGQPGEDAVLVMLRGDLDVSEAKLMHALSVQTLQAASEEEIRDRIGAEPGYASPLSLNVRNGHDGVRVIADLSLESMANFVTGANEVGYHVVNANAPRDFTVSQVADVAEVYDGATCVRCGGTLHIEMSVEIARCHRLGTEPGEAVGATYLDAGSQARPIVMGYYEIGLDRLLSATIEAHHDEYGIIWPPSIAPYDVHLIALVRDEAAAGIAEEVYGDLMAAGISVLYDDRNLSPGVMFADADLIGIPLRITVSQRSLSNGGVEVKWRHAKDREILALDGLTGRIVAMCEKTLR